MTSNSKHESLIGCEELGATDESVSLDATGEKVRLFEGQGMYIPVFLAGDLTKKEITSSRFSKDEGRSALGLR